MDMSAEIRLDCTPTIAHLHDDTIVQQLLSSRLTDSDASVREAALEVVLKLSGHESILDKIWQNVKERLMDRSGIVRRKALEILIELWNRYSGMSVKD